MPDGDALAPPRRHASARKTIPQFGGDAAPFNDIDLSQTDRVLPFAFRNVPASSYRHIQPRVTGEPAATISQRLSAPLAVLTAIQAVLPVVVAILCLAAILTLDGEAFDPRSPEVLIMIVLCLVLVRMPPPVTSTLSGLDVPNSVRLAGRWAMLVLALAVVEPAVRDFGNIKNAAGVALGWAVATPLVLLLLSKPMATLARNLLRRGTDARTCAFVGYNDASVVLAKRLAQDATRSLRPVGFFDDRSGKRLGLEVGDEIVGRLADLVSFVKLNRVDVVFISLPIGHMQRVVDLVEELHDTTASIYYLPDVWVFDLIQPRSGLIAGIPVMALLETPFSSGNGAIMKRAFDVCCASLILVILAPLLALVALLVKLSSPGPVIFCQRRYGLSGAEIIVYKFRTMSVMEDGPVIQQASRDDSRTTPLGAFLRRLSIDEFPQLLNVLQGRMSLVGPRPLAVAHNEQYRRLVKGFMVRHKVLPGMTGLAQVNGARGQTLHLDDMQARVTYDLEYLRHWSPTLDLKILVLTALRMFRDNKAY